MKTEFKTFAGNERITKLEQQGYRYSYEDYTEFFRELLETLAPDSFQQEG